MYQPYILIDKVELSEKKPHAPTQNGLLL